MYKRFDTPQPEGAPEAARPHFGPGERQDLSQSIDGTGKTVQNAENEKTTNKAVEQILAGEAPAQMPLGLTKEQESTITQLAKAKGLKVPETPEVHFVNLETAAWSNEDQKKINSFAESIKTKNKASNAITLMQETLFYRNNTQDLQKAIGKIAFELNSVRYNPKNIDTIITTRDAFKKALAELAKLYPSLKQTIGQTAIHLDRKEKLISTVQMLKIARHFGTTVKTLGNTDQIILNNVTIGRGNKTQETVTLELDTTNGTLRSYKGNKITNPLTTVSYQKVYKIYNRTDIIQVLNISLPKHKTPDPIDRTSRTEKVATDFSKPTISNINHFLNGSDYKISKVINTNPETGPNGEQANVKPPYRTIETPDGLIYVITNDDNTFVITNGFNEQQSRRTTKTMKAQTIARLIKKGITDETWLPVKEAPQKLTKPANRNK